MDQTNNLVVMIPNENELVGSSEYVSCSQNGCSKRFSQDGALKMHIVKSHGLIQTEGDKHLFHGTKTHDDAVFHYHCPVALCQYGKGAKKHFSSLSLVKQHYNKTHAERKFPCSRCGTPFVTEKNLKQHMGCCGVLYRCGTCQCPYTTKEALLMHCKRQDHVYPEEYSRQAKKSYKKRENSKPCPDVPKVNIITQPLLLVPVRMQEVVKSVPVQEIKPKPVSQIPEIFTNRPMIGIKQPVNNLLCNGEIISTVRQNALIQTDIYGIDTLAVTKNDTHKTSPQLKGRTPPKKPSPLKRRQSLSRDQNPSSPRRKKNKLTTGIQTAVSFTKKKGIPIMNSTQTTGDYIIETALRHANIHIEKKTVASQVTPSKGVRAHQNKVKWLKPRPVLVDSFSQVREQHIEIETSQNFTESETMTDLPPSISTQTFHSYLVNLYEQENRNEAIKGSHVLDGADFGPPSISRKRTNVVNINEDNFIPDANDTSDTSDIVQIYNENLESSVNYEMPVSVSCSQDNNAISVATESKMSFDNSPMYTAVRLDVYNTQQQQQSMTPNQDSSDQLYDSSTVRGKYLQEQGDSTTVSSKYLQEQGNTTDMGAQTMSGSEFDLLLQSSGIGDLMLSPADNHSTASTSQETGTDSNDLVNELNFLGTTTIDTNTQTADFNLFDSFVQIDSNTQTVREGLDFLDLVMTNMETQTLNDDDLISLGLLESTLEPGISEDYSTSVCTDTSSLGNQNERVEKNLKDKYTEFNILSSDCLLKQDFNNISTNDVKTGKQSRINLQGFPGVHQSITSHPTDTDVRVRVQTETQTMTVDTVEPLEQTETQTQVEWTDTDFETINMETQTTFEDLQQLCDWLK